MLKEYCDKCKKEIDRDAGWAAKKKIKISIPSCGYSEDYAEITLCKECFEKMKVRETVKDIGSDQRREKEPETVEKLLNIIKELVAECMEEISR